MTASMIINWFLQIKQLFNKQVNESKIKFGSVTYCPWQFLILVYTIYHIFMVHKLDNFKMLNFINLLIWNKLYMYSI